MIGKIMSIYNHPQQELTEVTIKVTINEMHNKMAFIIDSYRNNKLIEIKIKDGGR